MGNGHRGQSGTENRLEKSPLSLFLAGRDAGALLPMIRIQTWHLGFSEAAGPKSGGIKSSDWLESHAHC